MAIPALVRAGIRAAELLGHYSSDRAAQGRMDQARDAIQAISIERRPPVGHWTPHAVEARLSQAQIAELVQLYVEGDRSPELSKRFDVSEASIVNVLKRQGVEIRGNARVTAAQVPEMRRLRQRGMTYQAIGDRFGITRTSVAKRLK